MQMLPRGARAARQRLDSSQLVEPLANHAWMQFSAKASMSTNASSTSSMSIGPSFRRTHLQALTTSERLQKTLREASELLVRSHRRIVAWDELFC